MIITPRQISQIFKTLYHNVNYDEPQHSKLSPVMENTSVLKLPQR